MHKLGTANGKAKHILYPIKKLKNKFSRSHRSGSHKTSYPMKTFYSSLAKVRKKPYQSAGMLLGLGLLSGALIWFRYIK